MPITDATNRRLTKAFIDANPVTIVLVPREKTKKSTGGYTWTEGTPRDPQVLTIIEQMGLAGQPAPRVTIDGVERVVEFQLLGEWDCLLERFDVFSYQGKDWEVVDLYYDNGYERRVLVAARG